MQTDLETLKKRVLEATSQSAVAGQIKGVVLEPDRDEDGTDFLRIVVQVKNGDPQFDHDFEELLEEIERIVGDIDERYPSVRFSDAA